MTYTQELRKNDWLEALIAVIGVSIVCMGFIFLEARYGCATELRLQNGQCIMDEK